MEEEMQEELTEAQRAVVAGYTVLDEAKSNPAVRAWLNKLLDNRLSDPGERALMGLPDKQSSSPS